MTSKNDGNNGKNPPQGPKVVPITAGPKQKARNPNGPQTPPLRPQARHFQGTPQQNRAAELGEQIHLHETEISNLFDEISSIERELDLRQDDQENSLTEEEVNSASQQTITRKNEIVRLSSELSLMQMELDSLAPGGAPLQPPAQAEAQMHCAAPPIEEEAQFNFPAADAADSQQESASGTISTWLSLQREDFSEKPLRHLISNSVGFILHSPGKFIKRALLVTAFAATYLSGKNWLENPDARSWVGFGKGVMGGATDFILGVPGFLSDSATFLYGNANNAALIVAGIWTASAFLRKTARDKSQRLSFAAGLMAIREAVVDTSYNLEKGADELLDFHLKDSSVGFALAAAGFFGLSYLLSNKESTESGKPSNALTLSCALSNTITAGINGVVAVVAGTAGLVFWGLKKAASLASKLKNRAPRPQPTPTVATPVETEPQPGAESKEPAKTAESTAEEEVPAEHDEGPLVPFDG